MPIIQALPVIPGLARTLGNLGKPCALSIWFIYRPLCGLVLRLTEDKRWRRLNMFAWTRS